MLLATYALATLTVEQKCERSFIQRLQHFVAQALVADECDGSAITVEAERLIQFAERHWSRLQNSLIPALREASHETMASLQSIENLGRCGIEMLPRIRSALRPSARLGQQRLAHACHTVQDYCQNLLERLACEEELLLPLAHRVLPSDAWCRVGTEFLLQDAQRAAISAKKNYAREC
jgi:hemerythrin-like domain-containing protein